MGSVQTRGSTEGALMDLLNDPRLNLMTENDVSRYLGISKKKLQKDRQMGIGVPYIKVGRCVRYSPSDCQDFVQRSRIDPSLMNTPDN